jgi:hypothetical protein
MVRMALRWLSENRRKRHRIEDKRRSWNAYLFSPAVPIRLRERSLIGTKICRDAVVMDGWESSLEHKAKTPPAAASGTDDFAQPDLLPSMG